MSAIYIAEPGGQPATYSEDQAKALWGQGRISAGALYWKEGMADWRPAAEFFGSTGLAAPIQPARRLTKDASTLTLVLKVMLWISLGIAVLGVGLSAISLATGNASKMNEETLTPVDIVQMLLALAHLGVFLTTAVIFLMWIHRANRNARALGANGMAITPGWSVGWYFIPFANLWKPYEAMKEIWQASHNPDSWSKSDSIGPVSTWWSLWLVTNFLGQMSFRLSLRATNPDSMIQSEVVGMISEVLDIPLCLVAIRLVTVIWQKQREWTQPSP